MRILVTGGAGFIGSCLVRQLVAAGDEVCSLDKLTYAASLESLETVANRPNYRFARLDICDAQGVASAISAFRPDAIVHLAAESHVDRSIDAPSSFVMSNVVGTCTLLEAATAYWRTLSSAERAAFRFVHVSTDEVFGSIAAGRFTEASRYAPRSPYSASKAGADHLARAWFHTYGLPVIVSNCSNNYGPYQFPEKLIPLMIINGLEGKPMPVYGQGQNVRDWLHVEDHARALRLMIERGRPGESYCVGGDAELRNIDVVERICDLLDRLAPNAAGSRRCLIQYVADRPGHDLRYAVDPAKLRQELGWVARETFATGLEATVRWYLANERWWRPLRDKRYAGERLGQGI